jgi:hypothetical protein
MRRSCASCPSRTIPRRSAVRVPGQVLAASKPHASHIPDNYSRARGRCPEGQRRHRGVGWGVEGVVGEPGRAVEVADDSRENASRKQVGQMWQHDSFSRVLAASKPRASHIPDNYSRSRDCHYGVGARVCRLVLVRHKAITQAILKRDADPVTCVMAILRQQSRLNPKPAATAMAWHSRRGQHPGKHCQERTAP